MKPENITFLEQHRGIYDMLIRSGELRHMDGNTRDGILRVIKEEWSPTYMINLWCGECVCDMVKHAYNWLDKYLATLPPPEPPLAEGERIVEMTFPKDEPPPPINKTKRKR